MRLDSYKPRINGVQFNLGPSQMAHLCLLFLERMPKNSVDLDHITNTMIRDMCQVMLHRFGHRAMQTDLNHKSIMQRQDNLQHLNKVIPHSKMWEPSTDYREEDYGQKETSAVPK